MDKRCQLCYYLVSFPLNPLDDKKLSANFTFLSKMTDVYEGSLIRLFRRLEELLRQIAQAAKVMGSEELEQKFETALGKVRRDIVAAQSLYL
jgi:ATP-dependent RNA helicase DOB1